MRKLVLGYLLMSCLVLASCSSGKWASIKALGQSHHIKQYSGGKLIGEWDSVGKIDNEGQSDGYYFEDKVTNKLIMVSGDVQITVN